MFNFITNNLQINPSHINLKPRIFLENKDVYSSFLSDFKILLIKRYAQSEYTQSKTSAVIKAFNRKFASFYQSSDLFRQEIYDWLSSQGLQDLTLKFGTHSINLRKDDYDSIFSRNIIKYAFGLRTTSATLDKPAKQENIINSLYYMQDDIKKLFDFVKELSLEVGNKKLIFYPNTPKPNGYYQEFQAIEVGTSYFPTSSVLNDIQGDLYPTKGAEF